MNPPVLDIRSTNSSDSCYQRCNRQFWIAYVMRIRPRVPSQPLRIGSAFHAGLDAKAQGASPDNAVNAAMEYYSTLPKWVSDATTMEEFAVEQETAYRLLMGYFWKYQDDEIEIVATEQAFEIPIYNPSTGRKIKKTCAGKIDKIIRVNGRLMLMEHKTTGDSIDIDSDFWRPLRLDFQISRYFHAAQRLNYPVESVLYDVVHKPDIKPRKIPILDEHGLKVVLDADGNRVLLKNGKPRQSGDESQGWTLQQRRESSDEYGERLNNDIADRPQHYYARREISRMESDLAEFDADLYAVQMQIRDSLKYGRWPRNVRSCRNPFPCAYLKVCDHNFNESVPEGFVRVDDPHPELGGQPCLS